MDILLDCLADENVEVREMASKVFSGVVRCSQRQSILLFKVSIFIISIGNLVKLTLYTRIVSLRLLERHLFLEGGKLDTRKPYEFFIPRYWEYVR